MDKKLNELRQARARAMDELQALLAGDPAAFDAKEQEVKDLDARIAQTERALALTAQRAQPSNQNAPGTPGTELPQPIIVDFEDSYSGRRVRKLPPFEHYLRKARALLREAGVPAAPDGRAPFRTFGEQLIAIARYGMTHGVDADLHCAIFISSSSSTPTLAPTPQPFRPTSSTICSIRSMRPWHPAQWINCRTAAGRRSAASSTTAGSMARSNSPPATTRARAKPLSRSRSCSMNTRNGGQMTEDREQTTDGASENPSSVIRPLSSNIVDKWVRTFIYGSVASRDTDAFNYLTIVAVVELKRLLAAEDKP